MYFLEWLSQNQELAVLFMLGTAGISIATVAIVASTVRTVRLSEKQMELKMTMVEQGMSTDQIERALKA